MSVLDNIRRRKGKDVAEQVAPASAVEETSPDASDTPQADKPKRARKKLSIFDVIILVMIIIGAGVLAYPTFSDWWNSYHQSRAIATYVNAVEETDPELLKQMIDDAHAYNKRLLTKANRFLPTDAEKAEYNSLLDLTGTGVIGYIQINSIGVNLPIYHGVEESVLQVAIGHITGSSLPVGGESTHAVVSGHRGLPSAKLFTDIDKLMEGDTFTITVLDQTITYEVDQIRIVDPGDMSDLNITQDADNVTLVTCTPYGINTHRLLVRGHRIENLTGMVVIPAEAVQIPNYVAVPAVAVPMLFIYLLVTLVYYRMRRPDMDHDAALKALREQAGAAAGASKPQDVAAEAEAVQASAEVEDDAPIEEPVDDSIEEPAEEAVADDQPENEPGPVSNEPTADDSAEADDNETEPRE